MAGRSLTRFAWLSIAGALLTIGLKTGAYLLTGSVGVLSDALESLVNLVAAVSVLVALVVAARPPDEEHPYGYEKAEYFSSGFEGALILVAALSIGVAAVGRLADLPLVRETTNAAGQAVRDGATTHAELSGERNPAKLPRPHRF